LHNECRLADWMSSKITVHSKLNGHAYFHIYNMRYLSLCTRDGTGNGKRPVSSGPVRYRSGISDRPVYRHRSRFLSFIYFARKTDHKRSFFWKSKNFFSMSGIIFATGHSFNCFTQSGTIIKLRNTSLIDFYIEIFSQNY